MFLSNRNRTNRNRKRGVRGPKTKRGTKVGGPHIANQVLRVTVPKSIFSGEPDSELVLKEEIAVRTFAAEPARVGAQWLWSAEDKTPMGSFWQGFRINLEVPCYVERLVETQREVIEEVKREAEAQYREFISKAAKRDFAEKEMRAELGLTSA